VAYNPPVDAAGQETVVVIGRLSPEKGIPPLLDAADMTHTKLLFVGDGPLRNSIEAHRAGSVTGWLSHDDVLKRLETARCLVFPSLLPETFGLSVIDAAARGVPSIVTDITGVAERVEHGLTGWLVQPGDTAQLTAALQHIQDDKVVSDAGRMAYSRYWQAPLSTESHVNGLLSIYSEILADNR